MADTPSNTSKNNGKANADQMETEIVTEKHLP